VRNPKGPVDLRQAVAAPIKPTVGIFRDRCQFEILLSSPEAIATKTAEVVFRAEKLC
jgi:hypothetical protein